MKLHPDKCAVAEEVGVGGGLDYIEYTIGGLGAQDSGPPVARLHRDTRFLGGYTTLERSEIAPEIAQIERVVPDSRKNSSCAGCTFLLK